MKKLLVIGIAAAALAGCTGAERAKSAEAWTDHGYTVGGTVVTKVVEIEGHRYVIMSGLKQGGIVHAESCPCLAEKVVRFTRMSVDGREWLVPECGRGTRGIPLP